MQTPAVDVFMFACTCACVCRHSDAPKSIRQEDESSTLHSAEFTTLDGAEVTILDGAEVTTPDSAEVTTPDAAEVKTPDGAELSDAERLAALAFEHERSSASQQRERDNIQVPLMSVATRKKCINAPLVRCSAKCCGKSARWRSS